MSYVYVLTHPCMPGVVKVGYTERDPVTRARELSGATGVPGQFRVAWARECITPRLCEYEVHQALRRYRVDPRREFFRCTVETAKAEIERSADAFLGRNYRILRVRKPSRYRRSSPMKYLWLAMSLCLLVSALTHPTDAWVIVARVLRVAISLGYMGHGHY